VVARSGPYKNLTILNIDSRFGGKTTFVRSHLHPFESESDDLDPLDVLLENINQGVYVLGADGHIKLFNNRLCELLDVPRQFLASRPTLEALMERQVHLTDSTLEANLFDNSSFKSLSDDMVQSDSHFVQLSRSGRTLEVHSKLLPDGDMVRTFTDISDYTSATAERQHLNQLVDAMQLIAGVGGWEVDILKQRITWTDGTYRIFEINPQQFTPHPTNTRKLYTPEAWAAVRASDTDPAAQSHDLELAMLTAKGRPIWVHSRGTTLWVRGRAIKRMAVVQDITARKAAQTALMESETRWKLALESVGDGLWDWQVQTGDEYLSPSLLHMYGYAPGEITPRSSELDRRTHPDDMRQILQDRAAHFDGITPNYNNEHRVRCKDGSWKWILSRGMVISRDAQSRPLRMIGTHTDITERKVAEAKIWQQAHFDALTGLPNRRMLRDRVAQSLKNCRRSGLKMALLFIDLDRFKEVNDTLGHDHGDQLLVQAAQRIQACLREVDTVARMGGDEFTVLISELDEASHLQSVLPKLLKSLSTVFQLGEQLAYVSASIGVTVYPFDATTIDDLLKNADQALYAAKGAGRNRYSFFTPALQEASQLRAQLTHDLRSALAGQQFRVVYQPIVEMSTGEIQKAEALVRWRHPTRGLISPAEFIPVAESSGLIVEIGEWVFGQAAAQVNAWRKTLHPQFQISVNKSPIQFENPNPDHSPWIQQLHRMGLDGDSITVEITEGLLLSTSDGVVEQLLQLRDEGINVSLDDFGTGYSSLSYLQRFDIDFVKIDQSFVRNLVAGSTDMALCQAIIAMAHSLDMMVVAEGVETEVQRDLLSAAGCDYAQGYLYSKPVSAPEFEAVYRAVMPRKRQDDWVI
jgi:diguanylate cyclase (GGDEF)-like protein/PAS domain S-box-containing protein